MVVRTIALMTGSFVAGTVAHEMTHWTVAKAMGADIESVSLISTAPQVVYRTATPGVDVAVRLSTVLFSLPLLVATIALAIDRPIAQQAALIVFGLAYLPRSGSDWQPVAKAVGQLA